MHFMKKTIFILLFTFIFVCPNIYALDFGNNITISDNSIGSYNSWYSDREDQEVEPGCVGNQTWDLEGFFLNDFKLTTVGGFDFKQGEEGYTSGDIFIDTDLDAIYGLDGKYKDSLSGNGQKQYFYDYGYEYAVDLDFNNLTYKVYEIDKTYNSLISVYYRQNDGSNPWRYNPQQNQDPIYMGSISYYENLSDSTTGLLGGNHNAFTIDLSFLPENTEFIAHFTIGCGNDNLMGQGIAHAPEPATLFLLGTGMIGLAVITRKRTSFKRD